MLFSFLLFCPIFFWHCESEQRAESTKTSATKNGELHGEAKVDDGESKTTKRGDEEHKTTVEDINDKRAQGGGKRKRQGDPLDEVNGDGEDGLEEQPRKKKKKKKKNREDDDDGNRGEDEQTANGLTEEDNVDAFQQQSKQNGISEELEGKKKRKGKKKREREVNGDESLKIKEVKGNQTESDCKSRKRKDKRNNDESLKGKKSKKRKDEKENGVEEAAEEEEDAADDDDVTEQSRRGGESPQKLKCFIEPCRQELFKFGS